MDDILFAIDEGLATYRNENDQVVNLKHLSMDTVRTSFPSVASGYCAASCGLLLGYPLVSAAHFTIVRFL